MEGGGTLSGAAAGCKGQRWQQRHIEGSGTKRESGRSVQVGSTKRAGSTYHERWGCMDRVQGHIGGGWNMGGGCQWRRRHVQGGSDPSLWPGMHESGLGMHGLQPGHRDHQGRCLKSKWKRERQRGTGGQRRGGLEELWQIFTWPTEVGA